jgi:hypothetical protein
MANAWNIPHVTINTKLNSSIFVDEFVIEIFLIIPKLTCHYTVLLLIKNSLGNLFKLSCLKETGLDVFWELRKILFEEEFEKRGNESGVVVNFVFFEALQQKIERLEHIFFLENVEYSLIFSIW